MKKILLLSMALMLLGIGCTDTPGVIPSEAEGSQEINEISPLASLGRDDKEEVVEEETVTDPVEVVVEEIVETEETEPVEHSIYVQFVVNVHDWVFPGESIETLTRLIDLHEEYQIPVEFHLTGATTQNYVDQSPELIERLRTSEYVAVSYHVRPPHPMYGGFDNVGLMEMSAQDRYETLLAFESHKLDMETGRYVDEPGGYQFLKDQLGYAPRIVGGTNGKGGAEFSRVFEEMGALFTVLHERGGSYIEDKLYGLNKRPEDQEVKLYEFRVPERFDPEIEFADWTAGFDGSKDWFVNLKYHENNFYLTNTPFSPIYWEDWDSGKDIPNDTPYDLNASYELIDLRSDAQERGHWDLYTEALDYVDENSDWLTPINSVDLEGMLENID